MWKSLALIALIVLPGCLGEETAATMRANLMTKVLPDPADRQGIFLIFPLQSTGSLAEVEVMWFPDEVSEGEIARRVQSLCFRAASAGFSGKVGIYRDLGVETVTTASGTRQARHAFFRCLT